MRLVGRLFVAVSLLSIWLTAGMADPRLEEWAKVPPDQSGLVLVIDAPIFSATISDGEKQVLSAIKWNPKVPFIQQLRMKPQYYTLHFGALINDLSVVLEPGSLTYVRLARYMRADGETGITVAVSRGGHPVTGEIGDILESADQNWHISGVFQTEFINPARNVLLVNTEPPWPIPPPPKR